MISCNCTKIYNIIDIYYYCEFTGCMIRILVDKVSSKYKAKARKNMYLIYNTL